MIFYDRARVGDMVEVMDHAWVTNNMQYTNWCSDMYICISMYVMDLQKGVLYTFNFSNLN